MNITDQDRTVCMGESDAWLQCLQDLPLGAASTTAPEPCLPYQQSFLKCAAAWRAVPGNGGKKLRGKHQGEAPPQCRQIACCYESCMQEAQLNSTQCTHIMRGFKTCVNAMFLSEYVT